MIDLHILLPGLDDCAPDLAMSPSMGRASVDAGVTSAVCAPHMMFGLSVIGSHDVGRRRSDPRCRFDLATTQVVEISAWDIVRARPRGVVEGMLPRILAGMSGGVREVVVIGTHS